MSVPLTDQHLVLELEFSNGRRVRAGLVTSPSQDFRYSLSLFILFSQSYLVLNVVLENTKMSILTCSIPEQKHVFCFRDFVFNFQMSLSGTKCFILTYPSAEKGHIFYSWVFDFKYHCLPP